MNTNNSLFVGFSMSGQKDVQSFPPVPMVYESMPARAWNWEYHVLSIDPREKELPDTAALNELGDAGWLLVGVLRASEREMLYYFVRQQRA